MNLVRDIVLAALSLGVTVAMPALAGTTQELPVNEAGTTVVAPVEPVATPALAVLEPHPLPGWALLAEERDLEAIELFRESVLDDPESARAAAGWSVAEASRDHWRLAARLMRAAFLAPDASTLPALAARGAARERVAELILRNQERLVLNPVDRDIVFVHAAFYVLLDDRPAARYASLLLEDVGDTSEAGRRLRAIVEGQALVAPVPITDDATAPPAEPAGPVDYNALRTRIGHMSDLLERFSQKLMGRLNGVETPAPAAPAPAPAPDAQP